VRNRFFLFRLCFGSVFFWENSDSVRFGTLCLRLSFLSFFFLGFILLLCVSMCVCDYNTYYKCNNGRPARLALAFLVDCHCCLHYLYSIILTLWQIKFVCMYVCVYVCVYVCMYKFGSVKKTLFGSDITVIHYSCIHYSCIHYSCIHYSCTHVIAE